MSKFNNQPQWHQYFVVFIWVSSIVVHVLLFTSALIHKNNGVWVLKIFLSPSLIFA